MRNFYYTIFITIIISLIIPPITFAKDYDVDIDLGIETIINYDGSEVNYDFTVTDLNINIDSNYGYFVFGRNSMKMGPGYFSQLMVSENAYPMEMIYHFHEYNFFGVPFQGEQLVAFLDNDEQKKLFAHRMSNNTLIPNLEVGVSESLIAYKEVHPAYYIPLPFWPYYLSKKMIGIGIQNNKYDRNNDNYVGLDFTYHFDEAKVYGELLVDEYPMLPTHNHPRKTASLLGVYYPIYDDLELRSEYSNVHSYTYLFRYPEGNYTYKGKPIGHWLGSDGDVFDIEVKKYFAEDLSAYMGLRYVRHGSISLFEEHDNVYAKKKYYNDIVQTDALLRAGLEKAYNKYIDLKVDTEIGKAYTDSEDETIFNIDFGVFIEL